MSVNSYRSYEKYFLEAMATHYEFNGSTRIVFMQRFLEDNADLKDNQLAEVLDRDLKDNGDPAIIVRDRLHKICQRFEKEGCEFNGCNKGKWQIAKKWLRQEKYPEWLKEQNIEPEKKPTLDQLWQQLLAKAIYTDQMRPVLSEMRDMVPDEACFSLGSHIRFDVNLGISGYLLLLEKGTSGKLWCLCPSDFALEPLLRDGQTTLPQSSAPQRSFELTGNPGQEQIIAVVTQELQVITKLVSARSKPLLQLNEEFLTELLNYLNSNPNNPVFYMEYTVTS
jgi:Domain of unknown function (DUF4384)